VIKKIALMSLLCFSLLETAPVFADDPPPAVSALAPADRYFGQLKMSVLGMRNAIKDISLYTGAASGDVTNLFHKLTLVEDALSDLKTQFPKDTWVPQLGLSLAQAFMKIHVGDSAVHANDAIDWVIADYPLTDQAFYAKGMRSASFGTPSVDVVPIEPLAASPGSRP
jgi:hypothetical protein